MTTVQDAAPATLGDRIKAQRKSLGLSSAELARRAGVSGETLAGWENGTTLPRANRLLTLAGVLETSIGWLLEGKGNCAPGPSPNSDTVTVRQQLSQARELAQTLSNLLDSLQAHVDTLDQRSRR